MGENLTGGEQERLLIENAWLNYFNQYLWKHGLITEKEHGQMTQLIAEKKKRIPQLKV